MVSRILLAPGASGSVERLSRHAAVLRERGMDVRLVALPRGRAERAVPVYRAALEGHPLSETAVGGHSFGGRVASLLAAETAPAAVVLLSYPLHAPGRPDAWEQRTEHWSRIACPVLLLSGESDPFARIGLLRAAVVRLPDARLITYPGVGHGLGPVLDAALEEVMSFLATRS
jgi:predicted alpha/beta-hydrolase family hydrolase